MTNLLTRVLKRTQPWVATMVCSIYKQPSGDEVHIQHEKVVDQLAERFPQAAAMLDEAGVGKTHLAVALALKSIENGYGILLRACLRPDG